MYYVDNNSGSPTMPALSPAQSNIPTWFTEGDKNKGISWIGQDWLNILQAELLNILSEAGIKPDKGKLNQLTLSIKAIITANAYTQANNLKEIFDAGVEAQAAARGHLGLGKLATKDSLGPSDVNALAKDQNLNDVPDKAKARTALQLGNSATRNVGTTANTVAAGDDSRITGAMQKDQNGADIPDKPGFIKNVGLAETVNLAAGAMQKSANGGDIQNVVAFRNALQLGTAALASMGVGKNQVLSASDSSFFAGGNGYLYIPCLATTGNPVKIMLQWGIIQTRGGENNIYNLPYAFPTAGLWAMGCRAANGYSQSMNVSIENRSQIRTQNWAPAGAVENCCFFAVGYL